MLAAIDAFRSTADLGVPIVAKVWCPDCGKDHEFEEGEVAFDLPDDFFALDGDQRATRGHATSDLCLFDGRYFVRGVLDLPIRGENRPFGWGVWAEVSEQDFRNYMDRFRDPAQAADPPFPGGLANSIPHYSNTIGLRVSVQLTGETTRPAFTVVEVTHPLGVDQSQGILLERVLEFLSPYLHRATD